MSNYIKSICNGNTRQTEPYRRKTGWALGDEVERYTDEWEWEWYVWKFKYSFSSFALVIVCWIGGVFSVNVYLNSIRVIRYAMEHLSVYCNRRPLLPCSDSALVCRCHPPSYTATCAIANSFSPSVPSQ